MNLTNIQIRSRGDPLSQYNMTVNSDTSDLQGLEFTYDVQRQKTRNRLTKETLHKMSLYNYDLCSFGLKYSQAIALGLSGDSPSLVSHLA